MPTLKCFSSHLVIGFAQSIEAVCDVENEDVVEAAQSGDAPTTSEWSTILLLTKVCLISEVLWYLILLNGFNNSNEKYNRELKHSLNS